MLKLLEYVWRKLAVYREKRDFEIDKRYVSWRNGINNCGLFETDESVKQRNEMLNIKRLLELEKWNVIVW